MPKLKPPYDHRLNKPFITQILDIIPQNHRIKTFIFEYNPISEPIRLMPGQFLMIWIPGNDEIPMSISHILPHNKIGISVANVGETTNKLHQMKIGDKIGIRGPYGTWYEPQAGTAIVIGGGIGMASVLPLIQELSIFQLEKKERRIEKIICIEGAKTEKDLIFRKEIEMLLNNKSEFAVCTDDGSCGYKGFATEKLDEILDQELNFYQKTNNKSSITVYACGPEKMLFRVFHLCEKQKIPIQLSLERMMRCGFGICGLCAMEPNGLLVCRDGPIFHTEDLQKMSSFGKETRDFSGKPLRI